MRIRFARTLLHGFSSNKNGGGMEDFTTFTSGQSAPVNKARNTGSNDVISRLAYVLLLEN